MKNLEINELNEKAINELKKEELNMTKSNEPTPTYVVKVLLDLKANDYRTVEKNYECC